MQLLAVISIMSGLMTLTRQQIERRDFPIARRGYEREIVDAHLALIAEAVEQLRSQVSGASSLAAVTGTQVQTIVEAAQESAGEIEQEARDEAKKIRATALRDARDTREQAAQDAQQTVTEISEAAQTVRNKLDNARELLAKLDESLGDGRQRLDSDLAVLDSTIDELSAAASDGAGRLVVQDQGEIAVGVRQAAPSQQSIRVSASQPDSYVNVDDELDEVFGEELDSKPSASSGGGEDDGTAGARIVVLNMALNGTSRDEAMAYVEETYDLANGAALVDEVYTSLE